MNMNLEDAKSILEEALEQEKRDIDITIKQFQARIDDYIEQFSQFKKNIISQLTKFKTCSQLYHRYNQVRNSQNINEEQLSILQFYLQSHYSDDKFQNIEAQELFKTISKVTNKIAQLLTKIDKTNLLQFKPYQQTPQTIQYGRLEGENSERDGSILSDGKTLLIAHKQQIQAVSLEWNSSQSSTKLVETSMLYGLHNHKVQHYKQDYIKIATSGSFFHLTISYFTSAMIYLVQLGKILFKLQLSNQSKTLIQFSDDSKQFLLYQDSKVMVWDLEKINSTNQNPQIQFEVKRYHTLDVQFINQGKSLAIIQNRTQKRDIIQQEICIKIIDLQYHYTLQEMSFTYTLNSKSNLFNEINVIIFWGQNRKSIGFIYDGYVYLFRSNISLQSPFNEVTYN